MEKICAACRKEIDGGAIICPYCRSDTNYQYFMNMSDQDIIKRGKAEKIYLKKGTVSIICIAVGGISWLIGTAVFGFFVGLCFGVGAAAGVYSIADNIINTTALNFICPNCHKQESLKVVSGTLLAGQPQTYICTACHKATRFIYNKM